MSGHTPGKTYSYGRRGASMVTYPRWREFRRDGERAALVRYDDDARLFRAAPALYEALRTIIERSGGRLYDTDQETGETFYELARAALALVDREPHASPS